MRAYKGGNGSLTDSQNDLQMMNNTGAGVNNSKISGNNSRYLQNIFSNSKKTPLDRLSGQVVDERNT
jgi:hypothetical protein